MTFSVQSKMSITKRSQHRIWEKKHARILLSIRFCWRVFRFPPNAVVLALTQNLFIYFFVALNFISYTWSFCLSMHPFVSSMYACDVRVLCVVSLQSNQYNTLTHEILKRIDSNVWNALNMNSPILCYVFYSSFFESFLMFCSETGNEFFFLVHRLCLRFIWYSRCFFLVFSSLLLIQ